MTKTKLKETLTIFETRLSSLAAIMKRGREELFPGCDDMSPILGARLAEDMLPFPYQLIYTCNQPNQFLAWLKGEDIADGPENVETMRFAELQTFVSASIEALKSAKSEMPEELIERDKTIKIPPDISFTLSGEEYVDEWLMPNFYFHFVTAYNIFRSRGLTIGKADYMAHLLPRIYG